MKTLCLSFLIISSAACAQVSSYSQVNIQQNTTVYVNYSGYYLSIAQAINNFTNVYKERKLQEAALIKLNTVHQQYDALTSKPDSIVKGWHSVLVTDNDNFCREAKVFVSGNRINDLVIDNYLPLSVKSTSKIKKGKNAVILSKSESETTLIDVFFIYDWDEPHIVDPPITPGYVCFWTSKKKYWARKYELKK